MKTKRLSDGMLVQLALMGLSSCLPEKLDRRKTRELAVRITKSDRRAIGRADAVEAFLLGRQAEAVILAAQARKAALALARPKPRKKKAPAGQPGP